ncbi:OmpA family protein [Roseovarius tibetensis]|uniref:OmpA family protein n=1 Tax=Roseovarius tibetensis TaxID=2685897 RepID=UPI003D7F6AD3
MSLAPLKATTALVASLSLLMPQTALVATASAQEAELLCMDGTEPPCPEGEPIEGSSEEGGEEPETEVQRAGEAAEAEAEAQAAEAAADAAAVEAQAAEEAATAAAEAQAVEEAAAQEAEVQAAQEAAAAEAEARAVEEAAAAEAEAKAAEAEVQAAEEAETAAAEAKAAEKAAAAGTEAQAAEAAAATEAEAEEEAESQATEDAAAQEATSAEAEAQSAEEAAEAEAQADENATQAEAGARTDDAPVETMDLVDPTVAEGDETPDVAAAETAADPEDVVEETLDAQSVRSSEEDFETAIGSARDTSASDGDRDGLSTLEKALLLGLGAVVVGSVLRNGDRVVENTGDRVVVEGPQGFSVYKNDDALLRQPGATMRTETYADGSTRTTLDRADGSQVVTIRDARGRVLRRDILYPDGTEYELFDDLEPSAEVDVRRLQEVRPVARSLSVAENDLETLRAAIRDDTAYDAGRTFSLRQIREIEQVRSLVPAINLDTVTFASGSAAIPPKQARSLVRLGILIEEMLFENPREVFLIEGHTDATGRESYNLALSDRRAESVALALTEAFRIPPENLIVQGYGESFLKVRTEAAEERNRRATVRRITPLLRQMAAK